MKTIDLAFVRTDVNLFWHNWWFFFTIFLYNWRGWHSFWRFTIGLMFIISVHMRLSWILPHFIFGFNIIVWLFLGIAYIWIDIFFICLLIACFNELPQIFILFHMDWCFSVVLLKVGNIIFLHLSVNYTW